MKKKIISTLALSAIALTTVQPVLAVTVNGKTDTNAEFGKGNAESIPPVKPDTNPEKPIIQLEPDPVIPPNLESIYVTHLPDISFGKDNRISATSKVSEISATMEKRTASSKSEEFYIPHSVQVVDLAGSGSLKWSLSVAQDDLYKGADGHKLSNTRINICENSLTNTVFAVAELGDKVSGLDTSTKKIAIPVTAASEGSVTVLDAKAGATINSFTSAVFKNNYKEEDYSLSKTPKETRYEGLKLNVPAKDQARTQAYTAKLTWTLSVTP